MLNDKSPDFEQLARELKAAVQLDRTDLARALHDYYMALLDVGFSEEQAFALVAARGLDTGAALVFFTLPVIFDNGDWRQRL